MDDAGLSYTHVFPFSPRKGHTCRTHATQLDKPLVKDRAARLRAKGADALAARMRALTSGSTQTLLVEKPECRPAPGLFRAGAFRGRLAQPGSFVDVRIASAAPTTSDCKKRFHERFRRSAAATPTLLERLKQGLSKSTAGLSDSLTSVFTHKKLDAATVAELEEALIRADLGAGLAARISGAVGKDRFDAEIAPADLRAILAGEIFKVLKAAEKPLAVDAGKKPFIVLIATGVNGTGKTTTIGKIAKQRLSDNGHKVLLAARR